MPPPPLLQTMWTISSTNKRVRPVAPTGAPAGPLWQSSPLVVPACISDLCAAGDSILQRLIEPALVHNYKWDMRLYVLVTNFDPLTVYLYNDGLVRFASQEYSSSNGMFHGGAPSPSAPSA